MKAHDKVVAFDVYKVMKFSTINEELSAITVIDLESKLPLTTSKGFLERALVGNDIFGDAVSHDMLQILDIASIFFRKGEFMPLNRPPGHFSIYQF